MMIQGKHLPPRQRHQNVVTKLVVAPMRWIQDGQYREWETNEVNQDSLDSQMDCCHANRGNFHLMLS